MRLEHSFTPYTKKKKKKTQNWFKGLIVLRPETIRLLEESIDSTLFYINLSNYFFFLRSVSQAGETNKKVKNWNCIKQVSL